MRTVEKQWKNNETDEKQSKKHWINTENWWKTSKKQWKVMKNIAKTRKKQWKVMKNNEKTMKSDEKHCKNMEKTMKSDEKHWENNEKWWIWLEDFDPTTAGSRTWTRVAFPLTRARARALAEKRARGLRPLHWGYYNGTLQRGNTTGKPKGTKKKTYPAYWGCLPCLAAYIYIGPKNWFLWWNCVESRGWCFLCRFTGG